ncbi:CHASE2 domain-containing protein [Planktothrix mougeotii]|uniref:CHASE2 domain-containing protein n=1 Tax=Planktothrix mougeotii LEGE 06226 TaxID=1828728 RepID=A0ABR9U768_9CYAN|nr:CHASE2 domain-containing protein [Planktothrix mougeotii]MBE9142295.1 CHASE2 domain-containing protein [Planktothrix mougeotii LEGE 06226]
MNAIVSPFYLKVQRVEQVCLFQLSWGKGQNLGVTLPYPERLTQLYQEWQYIYLSFYQKALRGRVEATGKLTQNQTDWHAKLVQAEAKLLYEFHRWLRHEELYEIRATLAKATSKQNLETLPRHPGVGLDIDVFLTTDPIDVARLPWEAWEIGTEFAATGKIRIVRQPINIRQVTTTSEHRPTRNKVRVLVILGDETGLNFQADKEAVRALAPIAEIQFVGWQPQQTVMEVKLAVVKAIQDQKGWDILLFAGHSNETELTGGELGIAPSVSLSLSELIQPLTVAKQRGLQFALFNSCNGLSLANTLIDLGLNQVAIMREPIHNQVAQEFLLRFIRSLTEYHDVHDALLSACQFLKLEKHLTYPSAYLIPSLFRHPHAPPFKLQALSWKQRLKRWFPTKKEVFALTTLLVIAWQTPIQNFLLERRILIQAIYRNLTHQIPTQSSPPVLLILIDEKSILKAKISNPRPMDRSYLAEIINQLIQLNLQIIGIDYLLDRHQPQNDPILSQSLQNAVQNHQTWLIFGTSKNPTGGWFETLPELASPNWSLQGDLRILGYPPLYTTLLPLPDSRQQPLPFAYLLALAYQLNVQELEPPSPQLNSSVDWLSHLKAYLIDSTGTDYQRLFSSKARLQPITNWAYLLKQWWFHPLIDFSIPPKQVYQSLPAWQLFESPESTLKLSTPFVVLIAPGGYGEAGIATEGQDNFPLPMALNYWYSQETPRNYRQVLPGGEVHAYMTHHFIQQRFVIPIPDLLLILIAALFGKGATLSLATVRPQKIKYILVFLGLTGIYGLGSVQVYITGELLLPWVLPTLMFWMYIFLTFVERKFYG